MQTKLKLSEQSMSQELIFNTFWMWLDLFGQTPACHEYLIVQADFIVHEVQGFVLEKKTLHFCIDLMHLILFFKCHATLLFDE